MNTTPPSPRLRSLSAAVEDASSKTALPLIDPCVSTSVLQIASHLQVSTAVLKARVAEVVNQSADAWLGQRIVKLYRIEVTRGIWQWSVSRRYSEFYRLHEELSCKVMISRCMYPLECE